MAELKDTTAKAMRAGDKPLADGKVTGLRLHPKGKGQGVWKLRFQSPVTKKRRDMGLGSYPEVGLASARSKAWEARELIAAGLDPIEERSKLAAAAEAKQHAMTFEEAARARHTELCPGFANAKHRQQWINTLETYAFPIIGDKKLADLVVSDFADVLRPIWLIKAETASRVKQRCSDVMDWAWSKELVAANPVVVVTKQLPRQPAKAARVQHHPAMPWRMLPDFFDTRLKDKAKVTPALLTFVILTAARSGEARAAEWSEIDLDAAVWTIPASRMKAKVMHRVPLAKPAVTLLSEQKQRVRGSKLLFPAPQGGVLTDMALTSFLRKHCAPSDVAGRVATAHGFRSTFRDWASEHGYPRDLAEKALAHTIKNQVEAAYHRTDSLEQRRKMMQNWADYVVG